MGFRTNAPTLLSGWRHAFFQQPRELPSHSSQPSSSTQISLCCKYLPDPRLCPPQVNARTQRPSSPFRATLKGHPGLRSPNQQQPLLLQHHSPKSLSASPHSDTRAPEIMPQYTFSPHNLISEFASWEFDFKMVKFLLLFTIPCRTCKKNFFKCEWILTLNLSMYYSGPFPCNKSSRSWQTSLLLLLVTGQDFLRPRTPCFEWEGFQGFQLSSS